MDRINTRTSQAVEASVMMRILSLPVSFFRKFSSGELSSRARSVSSLCSMILNNILSIGLSSLMSLLYIGQIFSFAPALVLPSILIILATVMLRCTGVPDADRISRKKMKLSAEETGMSYAMLNGIQKIRLSGSEKRVFARWGRLYARNAKLEYNPPAFVKLNGVITSAITLAGTIVLYYLAVRPGWREPVYRLQRGLRRLAGLFRSGRHRDLHRDDTAGAGDGGADPEGGAGSDGGKADGIPGERAYRDEPCFLPV